MQEKPKSGEKSALGNPRVLPSVTRPAAPHQPQTTRSGRLSAGETGEASGALEPRVGGAGKPAASQCASEARQSAAQSLTSKSQARKAGRASRRKIGPEKRLLGHRCSPSSVHRPRVIRVLSPDRSRSTPIYDEILPGSALEVPSPPPSFACIACHARGPSTSVPHSRKDY